MELDDRKIRILEAIIKNYLETGEPVGSRTISKYTDLNLSSATIRNEMSDLEEMGYILQPHTSAGRIPSDKGYRFYVDRMMTEKEKRLKDREAELDRKEQFLIEKFDKLEVLLKNMAKSLAVNTEYTAMISAPKYERNRFKLIQLTQVEPGRLLCVIVTEENGIRNKFISWHQDLDNETLLKLNVLLNTSLGGLGIADINLAFLSEMMKQAGEYGELVEHILKTVSDTMFAESDPEIYTSGATNIFKYPELSDGERARALISTLEEKQQLSTFIKESDGKNETGIQVYIGNESPIQTMKDCSVVTATYELKDGARGTIGLIGPKRMDYERVVEALDTVRRQMDSILKEK